MRTCQRSLWESHYPPEVKAHFQQQLDNITAYLKKNCLPYNFHPFDFDIGNDEYSRRLNQWRLDNRLFLNPLNDLSSWPAAHDVFHLPNHTYALDEMPIYPKYFDILKQEFISACVLMFESIDHEKTHAADKYSLTYEHGDYSLSSVQIEKRKAAFRMAYSIFDKCASFLNLYLDLGHNQKKVNFRNMWLSQEKHLKRINTKIPLNNWRLQGLYAISLDLFENEHKELASPSQSKRMSFANALNIDFYLSMKFSIRVVLMNCS